MEYCRAETLITKPATAKGEVMNSRKKIYQLNLGSKNIELMKSEIDAFVKMIGYFLKHTAPGDFYAHKNPYIFKIGDSKWTIDVVVADYKVVRAKIKCDMAGTNQNWFQVYEYDGMKKVVNRQVPVWSMRQVWDKLPLLEEKLRQEFSGWIRITGPFVEASEMKF